MIVDSRRLLWNLLFFVLLLSEEKKIIAFKCRSIVDTVPWATRQESGLYKQFQVFKPKKYDLAGPGLRYEDRLDNFAMIVTCFVNCCDERKSQLEGAYGTFRLHRSSSYICGLLLQTKYR